MGFSKNIKSKIILSLIVIGMLFSISVGVSAAASIKDIEGHWAQEQIESWLEEGLARGYVDGTFRPDNSVTRAEFVTFINRAFDLPASEEDPGFKDVSADDWHYGPVSTGVEAGLLSGYPDGTFKPDAPIVRQEAVAIINRLLDLESDEKDLPFVDKEDIQPWALDSVKAVYQKEIIKGYPDNTFRPVEPITRAESVVILTRALEMDSVKLIDGLVSNKAANLLEDEIGGATLLVFVQVDVSVLGDDKGLRDIEVFAINKKNQRFSLKYNSRFEMFEKELDPANYNVGDKFELNIELDGETIWQGSVSLKRLR